MTEPDPYIILGIERDASPEQVRAAFRRAVRQRHPDTAGARDDHAARSVIAAYRLLNDPAARARYDAAHVASPPAAKGGPLGRGTSCGRCRGLGWVVSVKMCPTCAGRPEVTHLDPPNVRVVICRACRGAGRVRSKVRCRSCDGTGSVVTGGHVADEP